MHRERLAPLHGERQEGHGEPVGTVGDELADAAREGKPQRLGLGRAATLRLDGGRHDDLVGAFPDLRLVDDHQRSSRPPQGASIESDASARPNHSGACGSVKQ